MIKKITLIAFSSLMMIGCDGVVDKAINNNINGTTTEADIQKTSKVLIVEKVSNLSCAIIKEGVKSNYSNGKSFIKEGATCATFSKDTTNCTSETVEVLKAEYPDANLSAIQAGKYSCVIGGDKPTAN